MVRPCHLHRRWVMAQLPVFIEFSKAYQAGEFEHALALVDQLVGEMPNSAPLAWHRANCLEQLERYPDLLVELNRLLQLAPDYAPAIIKRVRYAAAMDGENDEFDDVEQNDWTSESADPQREAEMAAAAMAISLEQAAELRR